MRPTRHVFYLALAGCLAAGLAAPATAQQQTIKIGELNSYKSQPAFLDPYKKGWEMAIEEINAKGGVLGKKLEVISRDDGANPGEAVRVAEELVTREGVAVIAGTFLSHIGLAVTNFAGQNLTLSLAGQSGRNNISFVAVNPGPVRTERWAGLVKAMARDMKISYEEADKLAPASIPMGRIAEVDEVAALVVMLASPLMEMVNGSMIEIDGGQDKPLMDRFRDKPTG